MIEFEIDTQAGRNSREKQRLCLAWSRDPVTGKPVARWVAATTAAPSRSYSTTAPVLARVAELVFA